MDEIKPKHQEMRLNYIDNCDCLEGLLLRGDGYSTKFYMKD